MALELNIVWCGDHENGDNRIGSGGEVKWRPHTSSHAYSLFLLFLQVGCFLFVSQTTYKGCLFLVWVAHMISCGGLAYMIKQQTDDKGGRKGVSEVWGASGL
jgi:hypothetical protein